MQNKNSYLREAKKVPILVGAVALMALGVALYFKANVGADPMSTLCDGIYKSFGIARGTVSFVLNTGIFLALLFTDRKYLRLGSAFAAFGVGPFITLFENMLNHWIPASAPQGMLKLLLPLAAMLCIALGRALYLPCDCGVAPFDMMVLSLQKCTKRSYKANFTVVSLVIFGLGVALDGAWGYGTLLAIFATGYVIDFVMRRWEPRVKRILGL